MIQDKFKHESFKNAKEKIYDIDHYDDCKYVGYSAPINEMPCDCYSEQLFALGMEAQEALFYGADRS